MYVYTICAQKRNSCNTIPKKYIQADQLEKTSRHMGAALWFTRCIELLRSSFPWVKFRSGQGPKEVLVVQRRYKKNTHNGNTVIISLRDFFLQNPWHSSHADWLSFTGHRFQMIPLGSRQSHDLGWKILARRHEIINDKYDQATRQMAFSYFPKKEWPVKDASR